MGISNFVSAFFLKTDFNCGIGQGSGQEKPLGLAILEQNTVPFPFIILESPTLFCFSALAATNCKSHSLVTWGFSMQKGSSASPGESWEYFAPQIRCSIAFKPGTGTLRSIKNL